MIVYRLCSCEEANKLIKNNSMDDIGKYGSELFNIQQRENVSNHTYFYDEKYLHFFVDKKDIFHLRVNNNCICTYEIPDEVLSGKLEEGYYLDLFTQKRMIKVPEYAISTALLSIDYLIKIEFVNQDIDINDYLKDPALSHYVATIYNKEEKIIRQRKNNE